MPLEQSRIVIAPGVIAHPNLKNVPTGPMTSKQLKKSYKERNGGPKMTKAERRAEERALLEQNRLELEREKRIEREKRKRDKKKAEEEAAKVQRRKAGIPEKSRFVRPSQNRITGFLALGKRPRVDSDTEDADTSREDSAIRDMRPPKNRRLTTDGADEDFGYASPEHDMDTAMIDITMPVSEDGISTGDSQEDNEEHTRLKVASQRKAPSQRKERPKISDDEDGLEPVIGQFRSSQLAEAPNFGTIRTQTDESSSGFVTVGLFTKASQAPQPSLPKPSLTNPFAASQDYFAQFSDYDEEASLANSNTFMPDKTGMADVDAVSILRSLSVSGSQAHKKSASARRDFVPSSAHYDLFGTDSYLKSTAHGNDSIDKTYSPIRASPARINTATAAEPPFFDQFEASQDYDAMFETRPPPAQKPSAIVNTKTPKKSSQKRPRPKISDDEEEVCQDTFGAAAAPKPPSAGRSEAVKRAAGFISAPKPPAIDQPSAASMTAESKQPVVGRGGAAGLTTVSNAIPPAIGQFEASQDYLSFFATQAVPTRPSNPPPKKTTPKKLRADLNKRPEISDDEEYDKDFATYETVVEKTRAEESKKSTKDAQVPPRVVLGYPPSMQHIRSVARKTGRQESKASRKAPATQLLNVEPPSQDYDAMLGGTQALAPSKSTLASKIGHYKKKDKYSDHTEEDQFTKALLAHRAAEEEVEEEEREERIVEVNKQEQKMKDAIAKRIQQRKSNGLSVSQPVAKPLAAKTPSTGQVNPAARFDGFFSPEAPHAKPFQKPQLVKTPTPAVAQPAGKSQKAAFKKLLNQGQFAASQDYLSMLGDDDSDLDGDITPYSPALKMTMSPENMAKHSAYNDRQTVKVTTGPKAFKQPARVQQGKTPTPAELRRQTSSRFKLPVTPNNAAQPCQPPQQVYSAPSSTFRSSVLSYVGHDPPNGLVYQRKQVNLVKQQAPRFAQRTPQSEFGPQVQRHSAPPPPTQVLEVGDDFEVVSGTQLLKEMTEDGSLSKSTTSAPPAKEQGRSATGTVNNLSEHLPWLMAGGDGGPQRRPLKPVQQNSAKPLAFQKDLPKRASYPPNQLAHTGEKRFLPTKAGKTPRPAVNAMPSRVQTAPRFVQPKSKPIPKPASKTLPSIEVDDMMDFDFPSNSQVLREIEEDHRQRTRSRSMSVATVLVPPVQPSHSTSRPEQKPAVQEHILVHKSFDSNSQMIREMVEKDAVQKAKRDSEAPCPPKKQAPKSAATSYRPEQDKPSVEPISFNIASDELESLSQIERQMAEEDTATAKRKKSQPAANQTPTSVIPPPKPSANKEKSSEFVQVRIPNGAQINHAPKGDWLTRTTIAKNSVRRPAPLFQSRHPAPSAKSNASSPLAAPAAKSFQMESYSQIAPVTAEQPRAFDPRHNTLSARPKRTSPFPIPLKKAGNGRRQFSGIAPPPRRSVPPPSSPFDPPPSAQPDQLPSSTPIDVKRARKPLFFQEKPEDRDSSVVFDSKLQARKEEGRRKELEEEQRRQDEWMEMLLSHRAEQNEVKEEARRVV